MSAAGQTINDRILAARHSLAGQGLAKAVCKATTEEIIGPKKKHLDYLLHCTNEPNVSIPTLANLLIERTQNPSWVVVYKALITTHHLMCYGNERFTQYLASSNSNFQLNGFLDKTGVQGYDMSPFIRRYAKYLSEKSTAYRATAFDFCKVKRGKDGGTLRTMSGEKLLKTLPVLQAQVDALLEFDCSAQDLNNGVINCSFMLLFRDLIRLFACYNDGVINLLEKYFDMQKKGARDALDLYKKFLIRMDRVAEFLKVAESVGIEKGDIPDLAKAPSSLLEALEAHLAALEGRKPGQPGSGGTTPTQGGHRVNVAAAVNVLNTTSNAFGSAANGSNIDERTAQKLLAEEEAAMEKFREKAPASNPFAAAPEPGPEETPNILDLFGVGGGGAVADAAPAAPSDDLLQLQGNPFANMMNAAAASSAPPPTSNFAPAAGFSSTPTSVFPPSNSSAFPSSNSSSTPFVSDFSTVFGQQPSPAGVTSPGAALFGDVLQPAGSSSASSQSKMLTGDLDSSLANLASNLDFGNGAKKNIMQSGARGPPMTQGFGAFPGQQAQPQMGLLSPSDESNFAFPSSPSPSSNSSFIPQSSSHPSFPSSTVSPFPTSSNNAFSSPGPAAAPSTSLFDSSAAAGSTGADPFGSSPFPQAANNSSPFPSSVNNSPFPPSNNFSASFPSNMNGNSDLGLMGSNNNNSSQKTKNSDPFALF